MEEELLDVLKKENEYLIMTHPYLLQKLIRKLTKPFLNSNIQKVIGIDMSGLPYGILASSKLKVPFIPVLKYGKIKKRKLVLSKNYIDFSGKEKGIEIIKGSIKKGDRVLITDDWIESGETLKALIKLLSKMGAKVIGISVIFNQMKKETEKYFKDYNLKYLVKLTPGKKYSPNQ